MDYLGQQAKNAGLLDLSKQFLTNLAGLVPGAYVKKTRQEFAWNVAQDAKSITIDALLADEARKNGWLSAIAEFQAAVMRV
jgi:hypothetical protein